MQKLAMSDQEEGVEKISDDEARFVIGLYGFHLILDQAEGQEELVSRVNAVMANYKSLHARIHNEQLLRVFAKGGI